MFNTLGCMPHPIRRPQKYAPSARTSAGLKKSARALAVVAFGGRPRGNDDDEDDADEDDDEDDDD